MRRPVILRPHLSPMSLMTRFQSGKVSLFWRASHSILPRTWKNPVTDFTPITGFWFHYFWIYIVRIYTEANTKEAEQAKKERRSPVVIRHFSVHNLRHTFCTRLCEVENNIKLIMSIMGHSDVQTTMNIYNEIQEAKKKEAFTELNDKIMISWQLNQSTKKGRFEHRPFAVSLKLIWSKLKVR